MNNLFKRRRSRKNGAKNLVISVVILLEVIALLIVATYAWVETVSSIKIKSNSNETHTVDTYVFTDATIGGSQGTIDLADYFKQSGDMHLAPASSADGTTFFFPMVNNAAGNYSAYNKYRKGNTSDKNTTYLSATFRLQADENTDIFFTTDPAVVVDNDIRVSVTFQSKGSNTPPVTKIFANNASTTQVVNSTSGTKGATRVYTFASHRKGGTKIFDIGADETKIVTINVWLQKNPSNNNDLTQIMSASRAITNLGLISDLTPRIVTLIPTSVWDTSGTNEYFYAYCWSDSSSVHDRLYPITLNQETEHYSFEYNGKYDHTLFIRSGNADLVSNATDSPYCTSYLADHWNDNTVWNKTEDTAIPDISKIVNPTFYITTINGSTLSGDAKYDDSNKDNISDWDTNVNSRPKKSTGLWVKNASNVDVAPVTINLAHVDTQSDTWGTVSAKSFIGTTTSTHELEATNDTNTSALHHSTIHAIPGKMLQLKATAKTNYRFVGWYDNPEGIDNSSSDDNKHLLSIEATHNLTVPAEVEVTYYAKFIETRTLTITRLVDGSSTSTAAAGTITIDTSTSTNTATYHSKTVDKGETVTFKATAATGYTLEGIYTAATDGTLKYGPVNASNTVAVPANYPNAAELTLDGNTPITTYFARFTTNRYNVKAHACYSTNNGSTYTTDNATGGTVKAGSSAAGATSTASVKYKSTVTLTATPASGYEFVGWYSAATGGTEYSTSASYTYTLSTIGDKNVYARFKVNTFTVTANPYYSTNNGSSYSSGTTGGTVSPTSSSVKVGSSVSLTATAANGYEFVGWYSAASGGTQLSSNTTYSYRLESYANANVYARFIKQSWNLSYGVSGASNWNSASMSVSGNNVTASLTLTEGQNFSFQIVKTVGSTNTWYGGGGTYENITSTSFISNKTLSVDGGDIYMKGHAGTYTFTFNKSTKVLNVTASYSDITFTLTDVSGNQWLDDDNAIFWFDANGTGLKMTHGGTNSSNQNYWTVSFKSNTRTGQITIKRNNSGNTQTWSEFTWTRGYGTSYNAS